MTFAASEAVPAIALKSSGVRQDGAASAQNGSAAMATTDWHAQRDLLSSGETDAHFVVEVEADGTTSLRFGDNRHGMRPDPQTGFLATYRVGNGVAGNVGSESLYHLISTDTRLLEAITAISNPLPATGGIGAESVEDIRQNATGAFLLQERGVTPQDYIDIVTRDARVHRANAILRWTGSWYTVFLAVERAGGAPVDDAFKQSLRQSLEQYRMAGTDLMIVAPVYVPLEIAMQVTTRPGYLPGNVQVALSKIFSDRQWSDGTRGVFYPDSYSFGQAVYRNPLYAAASAAPGVGTVEITTFQRQGVPGTGLKDGMLAMDWLEIPILENNPQYPERGLFTLAVTTNEAEAQYVRG
jgi:predicted phage baseplate assembly protein